MVTVATVKQCPNPVGTSGYKIIIPVLGQSNSTDINSLYEAKLSTFPGCTYYPKVNDTVLVSFTDNDVSKPVIIGLMYVGSNRALSMLSTDELKVGSKAVLPSNTTIGNTSAKMLSSIGGAVTELNDHLANNDLHINNKSLSYIKSITLDPSMYGISEPESPQIGQLFFLLES